MSSVLQLPDDPALLKQMFLQERAVREEREAQIAQRDAAIEQIKQEAATQLEAQRQKHEAEVMALLRRFYGPKSERFDPRQLLLFGLVMDSLPVDTAAVEQEAGEPLQTRRIRHKHGRAKLPEALPRIPIEHDLTPEEKLCPCCGQERCRISKEVTEQLEHFPASFQVLQHIRYKYACKPCAQGCDKCDSKANIETAAKPAQPIEKGLPGPGLLPSGVLGPVEHSHGRLARAICRCRALSSGVRGRRFEPLIRPAATRRKLLAGNTISVEALDLVNLHHRDPCATMLGEILIGDAPMIPSHDDGGPAQVEWISLDAPSIGYQMAQLEAQPDGSWRVVPTGGTWTIALGMGLAGTFAAVFGVVSLLGVAGHRVLDWGGLIPLALGAFFIFLSCFLIRHIWKGPCFDCNERMCLGLAETPNKLKRQRVDVPFAKVLGLQILAQLQRGTDCRADETSYQLNLVLKDYRRLNIMDHSNLQAMEADAETLARLLQVPVWKRL